jgi:glycosyltransferase involved in cell wall biosynthesis
MRVIQVSVFVDPLGRAPDALLEAWPTLHVVARAAVLSGCQVHVVQAAATDDERTLEGVAYHFVAERAPRRLRRRAGRAWSPLTPRVFDRVAALAPDLVHFHGLSFPRHIAGLAKCIPGVPLLAQDHADQPPPFWRRRVPRAGLAHAAGVIFTARAQVQPWLHAGILSAKTPVFEVIESTSAFTPGWTSGEGGGEPSVSDATVEAAVAHARSATGLNGDPCVLWVGRLDSNKDPLTVLEAFSRAARSLPNARLWMCYQDAPLLDRVRARIAREEAALGDRVTLLGSRPHAQVEQLLRAADFLVLGSHREGSGYSVIEALACGAAPIVTDIPSLRRITGGGAAGALFPVGDAAALATAMVDLSARHRSALRRAARRHFELMLSLDAMGRELGAAYDAVLSSARAGKQTGERWQ